MCTLFFYVFQWAPCSLSSNLSGFDEAFRVFSHEEPSKQWCACRGDLTDFVQEGLPPRLCLSPSLIVFFLSFFFSHHALFSTAPLTCPALEAPAHGRKFGSKYFIGHEVHFTCAPGYHLVGPGTRLCQDDGTWSGEDAICKGKSLITLHMLIPLHICDHVHWGERSALIVLLFGWCPSPGDQVLVVLMGYCLLFPKVPSIPSRFGRLILSFRVNWKPYAFYNLHYIIC